jgi:hypothetical protein
MAEKKMELMRVETKEQELGGSYYLLIPFPVKIRN